MLGAAELEHDRPDALALEGESRAAARVFPAGGLVIERPNTEDLVGAAVVGLERFIPERPAAIRDPVALFEVDGLERAQPQADAVVGRQAPELAVPAEAPQARVIEPFVGQADVLAARQRLHGAVDLEPAPFEQADAETFAHQLSRQRDPRRAGADDADVGVDGVAVGQGARVVDHAVASLTLACGEK